ncbi:MAG: OmpA family protein, partial [Roseomonas sp.]|nr:OmpA family protein [Roseomonas sp.]
GTRSEPPSSAEAPRPIANFLVFFGWNDTRLSARVEQILEEAAASARRHNPAVIEIHGHDDLSQTRARAQTLSQRRADAVAEALIRLGLPDNRMRIEAFGKTAPLAPTEDGVREPQNRRVEIILRPPAPAVPLPQTAPIPSAGGLGP